jgi:hypothetical protein
MAARIVDPAIFLREPGDDPVRRLQPGLDIECHANSGARAQGLRDIGRDAQVNGITGAGAQGREHRSGKLVVDPLAHHDTLERRNRSLLVDDAVAHRCLAADHGQQAPSDIVILPELVEGFLPSVGAS